MRRASNRGAGEKQRRQGQSETGKAIFGYKAEKPIATHQGTRRLFLGLAVRNCC